MNNLMVILLGLSIAAFTGFNDATWAIIGIGLLSGAIDWLMAPWSVKLDEAQKERTEQKLGPPR